MACPGQCPGTGHWHSYHWSFTTKTGIAMTVKNFHLVCAAEQFANFKSGKEYRYELKTNHEIFHFKMAWDGPWGSFRVAIPNLDRGPLDLSLRFAIGDTQTFILHHVFSPGHQDIEVAFCSLAFKNALRALKAKNFKVPIDRIVGSFTIDIRGYASAAADGYYYDAVKKRYFRILPGNRNSPLTLEKLQVQKAKETVVAGSSSRCRSRASRLSLSKAIFHQETHRMPSSELNLQECLAKSRLAAMKFHSTAQLELVDFRGDELKNVTCEYLLGVPSNGALYGIWHGSNGTSVCRIDVNDVVKKVDKFTRFSSTDVSLINCFPPGNQVMDLAVNCGPGSEPDSVLCLTSHVKRNDKVTSSLGIQFIKQEDRTRPSGCLGTGHSVRFEFPDTLYSCAGGRTLFAVGGEKQIRLFAPTSRSYSSPYSGFCDQSTLSLPGKVTALRFSADSSVLYAGTNKGALYLYDTKDPKKTSSSTVDVIPKSIVYIHVLENQHQLIVSGHDNKLVCLDTRSLEAPLLTYEGHVNSCKRSAVSVDESLGVICSSGDDAIIRYWSLTSGKLLATVPLPQSVVLDAPVPHHCWFSNQWNNQEHPQPIIFSSIADKLFVHR